MKAQAIPFLLILAVVGYLLTDTAVAMVRELLRDWKRKP